MAYNSLAIGLADNLLTDLQTRIAQYDLSCTVCATVYEATRLLCSQIFHLLIVDLEYLRSVRQTDWLAEVRRISFVPMIVLSNTPEEDVRGMVQLGVDMCISGKHSYSMIAELSFAQLRRYTEYNYYDNPASAESAPFQRGDIYIDPAQQKVKVCGRPISLRHREFSLLLYFMRNPNMVLTAGQICEKAWGLEYTQPIDRSIHELRKQIEPNPRQPRYIQTVHRVGYKFTSYSSETCER